MPTDHARSRRTRYTWPLLLLGGGLPAVWAPAADEPALPPAVVRALKGHSEAVYAVAFSPDGKFVVTGSFDKTLKLWETATGKEVKTFGGPAGHQQLVLSVAVSPDGLTLASGSSDNTAKLWDVSAGNAPAKSLSLPKYVDAVAFNPAGTLLATGCHDGTVRLWDLAKGQQVRQINAHTTPMPDPAVYCLAWSPDGTQVASGGRDQSLKLWDATTGAAVREFQPYKEKDFEKGHRDPVFAVAFSPDGKLLASGSSDRTVKIWNVSDGTVLHECANPNLKPAGVPPPKQSHPGWVHSLCFTPDGHHLVSAGNAPGNRGCVSVWSTADARLVFSEELALGPFYAVAVSPDGKLLALASGPRDLRVQGAECYLMKMPDLK
jgi:WD40 repeat protein